MYMTVLRATADTIKNAEYVMDFDDGDYIHRWLTSQVHTDRADAQILYRIIKSQEAIYLYVQSKDAFPEKNIKRAGMKLLKSFETGDPGDRPITFNIFCSPNKTIFCPDSNKSKKQFLIDQAERKEWLEKKLSPFMSNITIIEDHIDNMLIKNGKKIRGAYFTGTGKVTDLQKYREAVAKGFGDCKCYGMGLLLCKG